MGEMHMAFFYEPCPYFWI